MIWIKWKAEIPFFEFPFPTISGSVWVQIPHCLNISTTSQEKLIILIVIFGLDSFPVCKYYQMENLIKSSPTFLNKLCFAYIASYTFENRFHGLFLLEMKRGHGILVVSLFASSIASIVQLLQKKTQYFAKCNLFPSHPCAA